VCPLVDFRCPLCAHLERDVERSMAEIVDPMKAPRCPVCPGSVEGGVHRHGPHMERIYTRPPSVPPDGRYSYNPGGA